MCGRQPDFVCGSPPQVVSPKLSSLPQWNHQVTSYMPSLGASIPLNTAPPVPRRSCDNFDPPEQHSMPSLIAAIDAHGGAVPHFATLVAPNNVFGGMASASYQ